MLEARIEIELDDGAVDAFVFCPRTLGRKAPILLLPDRLGLTARVESGARRLSAHNYFVLAPDLSGLRAEDRREAAAACLDHLADERQVDDGRVGLLGFGSGADLAMTLAARRAERIAAVAAYGGRGVGRRSATEIASRINCVVRLGYTLGVVTPRLGILEVALCAAGVDFDIEVGSGDPDWPGVLDLFARALTAQPADTAAGDGSTAAAFNPQATGLSHLL
jgi:dienelactone hydrolase